MRRKKFWCIPAFLSLAIVAALIVQLGGQKEMEKTAALEKATEFARMNTVFYVSQPRVTYSHSRFYRVLGSDENGQIQVGLNPVNGEVVRMVKLCPYPGLFTEKTTIDLKKAEPILREFLRSRKLPDIPKEYAVEVSRENNVLGFKQYEIVFRHRADGVLVMPDFVHFLLGGTGEVISYSKVHHDVEVSTKPKIDRTEAVRRAGEILGKGNLKPYSPKMAVLETSLRIVYPNYYFDKWRWEWSDQQALVWVVKFGEKNQPAIDVWIDAHSGKIQGGEIYERPIPDLIGIPDQTGDITGIWQPALDMMQFNTGTARTILGDVPEATVVNAIANGNIFILQTHGGTTATAESATISHGGTFDQNTLEPDEVPANHLYYALLSCCESGHDGSGQDFQNTFLSQGALCFQGYDPSINPDPYEEALVRYLAEGESLYNAHNLAVADTTPWFDIIIRWQAWCLNAIRLAPLKVSVSAPAHSQCRFTISASIYNGEAAQMTAANNVKAFLQLPAGFTLASGSGLVLQGTPSIAYGHSWTATWTVRSPFWTFGNKTFDVVVWSDNLGVAVSDFDNPYHKFSVQVSCPSWLPLHELVIAEIFRWWDWAAVLYPDDPIPPSILKYQGAFFERYRSEYFFRKNSEGFVKAMTEITKAERKFGKGTSDKGLVDQKAFRSYLAAVEKMEQFLTRASAGKIEDVNAFYKEVGTLQAAINETATVAFGPKTPQK